MVRHRTVGAVQRSRALQSLFSDLAMLEPVLVPASTEAKETEELVPTSKKDDDVRRMELLEKVDQKLIDNCLVHTEALARDRYVPHGVLLFLYLFTFFWSQIWRGRIA